MKTRVCDVCGKNMVDDDGTELIGATFKFQDAIVSDHPRKERKRVFYQRQLGPYQEGRTYECCWECMLKSYGIKP